MRPAIAALAAGAFAIVFGGCAQYGWDGPPLVWTLAGALDLRHYCFEYSGVPTLKNDALHGVGAPEVHLWRPDDWPQVLDVLRHPASTRH